MEIKITDKNILVDKKDKNEVYRIEKMYNEVYRLFVKYEEDFYEYYIKDFTDLFECMQFINVGAIKIV